MIKIYWQDPTFFFSGLVLLAAEKSVGIIRVSIVEPIKLHKQKVSGQNLEIGLKDQIAASSILFSEIRDSTISLKGKGGCLILINSNFKDCVVLGKKAYRYFLNSASWTNCKFEGRFSDCVFGYGTDNETKTEIPVEIENCDFTNANLDIVAFRGGLKHSTCKWPSFPQVLVISDELPNDFTDLPLPPELINFLKISFKNKKPDSAVFYDLTRFDEDLNRIYSVLFQTPGFHFSGESIPSIPSKEYIESSKSYYDNHKKLYKRYSLWSFISQSVSVDSVAINQDNLTLTIKSATEPFIPIPKMFFIRLKGVAKLDLANAGYLSETKNKKSFRIMGADIANDYRSVKLKGHRKVLGQIELSYDSLEFLDGNGELLEIESLQKWKNA